MAVDRADVEEPQLLEQRAAGQHAAGILLGPLGRALQRLGEAARQVARQVAHRLEGLGGDQPREIGAHGADRRGDRHVVVVQDDDQARMHRAGIVHRLVGHAGRHRAIADHRDHVAVLLADVAGLLLVVARHGEAERGGDRGRGVRGAEGVVFALGALGEAGQAAALAQGADAVAPAGQDLVRIALVADVPDQDVVRRVEDVVQGRRQLDHAEAGAKVAAGYRYGRDQLLAQLVGELAQVVLLQLAQVGRNRDLIEEGSLRGAVVSDLSH